MPEPARPQLDSDSLLQGEEAEPGRNDYRLQAYQGAHPQAAGSSEHQRGASIQPDGREYRQVDSGPVPRVLQGTGAGE